MITKSVRMVSLLLCAVLCLSLCACSVDPADVTITSIEQLNQGESTINSHADDWQYSQLESNWRQYVEVGQERLRIKNVIYPRIRKMQDGRYIMFYQDGQIGWNIYYATSDDLMTWSLGLKLFNSFKISVNGEDDDDRCYSTCDALVLENGEILAVASFRSNRHFRSINKYNGIAMRKSSDGGKTWSAEKVIYTGSNWEPSVLQLPSGEVQVYFTHSAPKNQPQIEAGVPTAQIVASSGTAMIRSFDNGETWDPYVTEPPYAAHRVSQQYTHTENGIKVFTDQMPVAILLNGTNTIALATESKFMRGEEEIYHITMSYSNDNWEVGLGLDEEGPADKLENMWLGSAPYIRQFPSGETVLANGRNSEFLLRIGDALARNFNETAFKTLDGTGYWGSLEVISSHVIVSTMAEAKKVGGVNQNKVMISQNYLNHRIDVPTASIRVDGSNADWTNYTDALFVGSESQAQTAVRPAQDDKYYYFLVETLDEELMNLDTVSLYLTDSAEATLNDRALRIKVGPTGLTEVARWQQDAFVAQGEEVLEQFKSAAILKGTVGVKDDTDEGYLVEIAIPKSMFEAADGKLRCHIVMKNQDNSGLFFDDKLGNLFWTEPATWIPLAL